MTSGRTAQDNLNDINDLASEIADVLSRCPLCSGSGEHHDPVPGVEQPLVSSCPDCQGTGRETKQR